MFRAVVCAWILVLGVRAAAAAISSEISAMYPQAAIVGDSRVVYVRGINISDSDAIKFVRANESSCDASPAGGSAEYYPVNALNCEKDPECEDSPSGGSATISFAESEDNLQLCYRFGLSGSFELKSSITFSSLSPKIQTISSDEFVAGQAKTFQFTGTHGLSIEKVKWVASDAVDCSVDPANGTSIFSPDADGYTMTTATYTFLFEVPPPRYPWKLCYQFGQASFCFRK